MAAVTRSFIVFQDDAPPSSPRAKATDNVAVPVAVAPPPPGPLLVYNPEKENINPFTGIRANSDAQSGKKRKTGVLATKLHVPPPPKKAKESKEGKKRGSSSKSSSSLSKSRATAGEKSSKRVLTSRKNAVPSRTRRSPSLPRVVEEEQAEQEHEDHEEPECLSQAVIDARCFELTVLPLADLSKAYEQSPPPEDHTSELAKDELPKEQLVERKEDVHVERSASPTPSTAAAEEVTAPAQSPASTPRRSRSTSVFSTPERKHIYSAFTFTSPSPSGDRYATLHASGMDHFSDPDW